MTSSGLSAAPRPVVGAALMLAELREAAKPPVASASGADETAAFAARLRAALAQPSPPAKVALRESAFPLFAGYDLASLLRGAGTVWADAQATGSAEDEADATSLAQTVKRVIARHPEIVQLGGGCECGPVCCC